MSLGTQRVAVVGVGYWGPNLVRNLFELPEAVVVAVCDRDLDALDRIARRYPSLETTTDLDALLRDDSIDAVVIATPVSTHHSLASAAPGTRGRCPVRD